MARQARDRSELKVYHAILRGVNPLKPRLVEDLRDPEDDEWLTYVAEGEYAECP